MDFARGTGGPFGLLQSQFPRETGSPRLRRLRRCHGTDSWTVDQKASLPAVAGSPRPSWDAPSHQNARPGDENDSRSQRCTGFESEPRHREEIHGPGHFEVISQEGQPGLGLVRSSLMLDHILPDGVWTGWIEPSSTKCPWMVSALRRLQMSSWCFLPL